MSTTALEVLNLKKTFGKLKAVDDVSFDVRCGEILAFLGPNGAGKTTIINLITGELQKDSGDIRVFEGQRSNESFTHNRMGVCTQELQLWPLLTCEEQLHFIGRINGVKGRQVKRRAEDLLERVGLQEKRRTMAKKLSGGMKRRLHLIMSLVHDPGLIILDEPEAGLDPQSRVLVREFIKSLAGSKTILLTTHNMDEAEKLADRVAVMDRGRLLELDTTEALRKKLAPEDSLDIVFGKNVSVPVGMDTAPYHVYAKDETMTVTGESLIGLMPEILNRVVQENGNPLSFDFRRSSLEDVFIKLTGRGLRE
ncbi:MAG: ABC transporter ATP-binding protein [Peptococcaceae bacterium]|nr:ABC transporter ATP-binding protein [Peptococcaceae bacterium]